MKNAKVRQCTRILSTLLVLCVMISLGAVTVLAVSPLTVEIPYSHTFTTEYKMVDNSFCYVATPLNGAPTQGDNGEFWISGYGNVKGSFKFSFDRAGTYAYRIEISPNYRKTGYTYDLRSYVVTCQIKESSGVLEATSITIQGNDNYKHSALGWDPTYSQGGGTVTPTPNPPESPEVNPSESPSPSPSESPAVSPSPEPESSPSPSVSPSPSRNGSGGGSGKGGSSSSSSSGKSSGSSSPKTGDDTPLTALIIMALASIFMVVFLILWDRRDKEKEGDKT